MPPSSGAAAAVSPTSAYTAADATFVAPIWRATAGAETAVGIGE